MPTTNQQWMEDRMQQALQARRIKGTIRRLQWSNNNDDESNTSSRQEMDFSSNDYLGLAHCFEQQ